MRGFAWQLASGGTDTGDRHPDGARDGAMRALGAMVCAMTSALRSRDPHICPIARASDAEGNAPARVAAAETLSSTAAERPPATPL
jgi:hypothetical protein